MSKAGFSTPQNDQFYKQRPYRKLNIDRKEIRLLRVQRQRMTIFQVEKQWPEWRDRFYPTPCNIKPSEPPGDGPAYRVVSGRYPHPVIGEHREQTSMDGWKTFTSAKPKPVSLSKCTDEHRLKAKCEADKIPLESLLLRQRLQVP